MEQLNYVTDQTPLAMMTLGQLKEALEWNKPTVFVQEKRNVRNKMKQYNDTRKSIYGAQNKI